jgi:SAM-dependent methyltransferase
MLGFCRAYREGQSERSFMVLDRLDDRQFSDVAPWITVSWAAPAAEDASIPTVRQFFENHVRVLIPAGGHVLNLGASHGETLGLRDDSARRDFEDALHSKHVTYVKIDLDAFDDQSTVVANAEDLRGIVDDDSQDVVLALELLEHTERPDRVLHEMVRTCRAGGHIFISVPGKSYPKHEFPVDLWRIGDTTLRRLFEEGFGFQVVRCETEGSANAPLRTLLLVRKAQPNASLAPWPSESLDLNQGLRILP